MSSNSVAVAESTLEEVVASAAGTMTKDSEGDDGTGSEVVAGDGPGPGVDSESDGNGTASVAMAGNRPGLEISCIFAVGIVRLDDVGRGNKDSRDDDDVPVQPLAVAIVVVPGPQVTEVSGKLVFAMERLDPNEVAIGES